LDSIQIPEKTYFKIGEVAKLLDLQPYVLRYWETEFDTLSPEKTRSGQRAYRRDDIEHLILIKTLLYDEMYTIAGARRQLKLRKRGAAEPVDAATVQRIVDERDALRSRQDQLQQDADRFEKAAEKLRHEASRLQLQNETLEDENAQLAAAQLEYESSIRRLREELDQRRETVRLLEDSTEALKQKLDERSEQMDLLGETDGASAEELERARRDLGAAQERVAQLELDFEESQKRLVDVERERAALADRVADLEGRLAEATARLTTLGAEKAAVEAQASDRAEVEALQEQIARSRGELETALQERDRLLESVQSNHQRQRLHWGAVRKELESLASLVN